MPETVKSLAQGLTALDQLELFSRADKYLLAGRYSGGPLSPEQVEDIMPKKVERKPR